MRKLTKARDLKFRDKVYRNFRIEQELVMKSILSDLSSSNFCWAWHHPCFGGYLIPKVTEEQTVMVC